MSISDDSFKKPTPIILLLIFSVEPILTVFKGVGSIFFLICESGNRFICVSFKLTPTKD